MARKYLPRILGAGAALLGGWLLLHFLIEPARDNNLLVAVRGDDVSAVQHSLRYGARVHARGEHGWTVMMEAACDGTDDMVPLLVAHGADVNARTDSGWTPLMMAVLRRNERIAEALVEHGADVNAANNERESVLMLAARTGSLRLTRLLVAEGADVHARDVRGETAIMEAESKGFSDVAALLQQASKEKAKDRPSRVLRLSRAR